MRPKLIKTNTVLVRRPCCTGRSKTWKLVPLICLSGMDLNVYGFEVGRKFDIYAQKKQLVLKAKGFKYEDPIIKKEVNKK